MATTDPGTTDTDDDNEQTRERTQRARLIRKVVFFVAGLLCILLGFALVVLPGPLTIPPIVLGFYIWSKEFAWAERLFDRAKEEFDEAWEAAKRKPVQSSIITVGGLVLGGVLIWAVLHFHLIAKLKDAVGL